MEPCPKCGFSNESGAVGCAGCGVILAKARARPRPSARPASPPPGIEADHSIPASRALLKVGGATALGLVALIFLLRLPPSAPAKFPTASGLGAPPAPEGFKVPDRVEDPTALTATDVTFLNSVSGRLNASHDATPAEEEIARVEALARRRPDDTRLRAFLVDLCFRRTESDLRQGAFDRVDAMLARIRSLDAADPRLATIEAWAQSRQQTPPEGLATDDLRRTVAVPPASAATPAEERDRVAPRIDEDKAQIQSTTFDVRFDGESQNGLARDVLFVLDRAYGRLSDTYVERPMRKIPVVLHSQQDYYTKTGAPFWSGGVYNSHDGAIQIPIKGMPSTLPREMENVLVHELSHAFVDDMSGGYAARDLQEGLAQYMEGKRIEAELSPAQLKRLANTGRQTVMSFYMLSLVVSQQLVQSRGQSGVNALLKAMKETHSEDGGFQRTFGQPGAAMRRDILETFWRRYS